MMNCRCHRCDLETACREVRYGDEREVFSAVNLNASVSVYVFRLCRDCVFKCNHVPDNRLALIERYKSRFNPVAPANEFESTATAIRKAQSDNGTR